MKASKKVVKKVSKKKAVKTKVVPKKKTLKKTVTPKKVLINEKRRSLLDDQSGF